MKLRKNVDTMNDGKFFSVCVADCRWFECSADFFLNGYVNGVSGQGSRSADIAFLVLPDGYLMGSAVSGLAQHVSHSFGCLMAM